MSPAATRVGPAGVKRERGGLWTEALGWTATLALMSPLVVYAGSPVVPLAGVFAVAAGIFLGLVLSGRHLHAALVGETLGRRRGVAQSLLSMAMVLVFLLLVLLAAVLALLAYVGGKLRLPGA